MFLEFRRLVRDFSKFTLLIGDKARQSQGKFRFHWQRKYLELFRKIILI